MVHKHRLVSVFSMLALVLVFALGAFTPAQADYKDPVPSATYTAVDFGFSGPDHLPKGWNTITLVNNGTDLHQLQFIRIGKGKTYADLMAALQNVNSDNLPSWAKFYGGPNAVLPGLSNTATVYLQPGNYAIVCLIPDEDGTIHTNLGMNMAVKVGGDNEYDGRGEPPVKADINIVQRNFSFDISGDVTSGLHTFRVTNKGTERHEAVLFHLLPGKTVADLLAFFAPGSTVPFPPIMGAGGLTGIEPRFTSYFTYDLTPGHYVLMCFFDDPTTGAPHFALGMIKEFDVP